MKHYGDITKLSGYNLPIVDVIVGGSPCQNLSIAGKREGLNGSQSGLFLEQIRLVKEMREKSGTTGNPRPRFMVWENVPGALSSNGRKDFERVLEEIVRIAEPNAPDVPLPKKWSKAGILYDELGRWSVAWRVHDAQFWGVPQRRKRIALVADFNGLCAPEVLFERQSLSRDIEQGGEKREGAAAGIETGIDRSIYDVRITSDGTRNSRAHAYKTDICRTLDSGGANPDSNHGGPVVILNDQGGGVMNVTESKTGTLRSQEHGHQPLVLEPRSADGEPRINEGIVPTLNTMGGGQRQPCVIQTFTEMI